MGKCIDTPFEENGHTNSARFIFRDLEKVGYIVGDETQKGTDIANTNIKGLDGYQLKSTLKFDYSKGLYYQMIKANLSWDDYITFINEPKHLVNPIRDIKLFENPFLEFFTMTPWWGIPLGYITPIVYHSYIADVTFLEYILCLCGGIFFWTFGEYFLHRFLFHSEDYWLPNHPLVLAHHFMIHGIHHAYPMDRYRLVFPVLPGYILLYGIVTRPIDYAFEEHYANAIKAGLIFGYVIYDMIHYFLHHSSPKSGYFKDLKIYHMQHHYKNGLSGFGVSSKFWDYVFFTKA